MTETFILELLFKLFYEPIALVNKILRQFSNQYFLSLIMNQEVILDDIITHKIPLEKAAAMYDIFNNKR